MSTAVLVTGGAGYVGSHACKALAANGILPVVYVNLSRGYEWAVRWGPLEVGDIADTEQLAAAMRRHRVAAVLHFAAFAYVGESMQEPGRYFANNVAGSLALLQAMRAAHVGRLIFSSTCATYGMPERMPITEDTPTRPVNPYGESKLMVERMLAWFQSCHGLDWVALRYFNAAGADPEGEIGERHDPEPHLIPAVIEAALGQRPALEIFGTDYPTPDGTAVRDFIHVADLASAHVAALRHLENGGASRALNLGTGQGHSVQAVVTAVERHSGRAVPTVARPRRPGDPAVLVADATNARRTLGWTPAHSSLDQIVATAWRWHGASTPAPREPARATALTL